MTSTGATQNNTESLRATGTEGDGTKKFPPLFPPNAGDRGKPCHFLSIPASQEDSVLNRIQKRKMTKNQRKRPETLVERTLAISRGDTI